MTGHCVIPACGAGPASWHGWAKQRASTRPAFSDVLLTLLYVVLALRARRVDNDNQKVKASVMLHW